MRFDYLIVGQGLAGSVLARVLLARGKSVCVIDREDPSAASRVAAGLVNPVTGRKLVVTWRAETLLPHARDYYRAWEKELGEEVYSDKNIWRFFQSEDEESRWGQKRNDPEFAQFGEPLPADLSAVPGLEPQRGGFQIQGAAHVDTRKLLRLFRNQLRERGALIEETFSHADLEVTPEGVRWREALADKIIFCEGHAASHNPHFSWIPFRHAKGELLTVRGPLVPENIVLNRGKWLLPVGDGLFRAGATYAWDDLTDVPTEVGREKILEGIRGLVSDPIEIAAHEAGVRPIVRDTRPVAGLHPAHPALGIFNGLGSKGVLWAPFFAEQLAQYLECGDPLDASVDVRRNF